MKLLAIDGNSIVNRAFYGIKLLTTKDGRYTNALVGFFNILSKLEQSERPDEIAIAFDLKSPTFRHQLYNGYKAQRKGMPQELADQLPVLKEMLAALGYQMVSCEGYEADDLLGTLAHACRERGDECVIATGDRDSFQLIGGPVCVQYEGSRAKRMDEAAIQQQYGVCPQRLIDVKSLMGDASDNIPGVAGIGEKTALMLIQAFGSLQGVYDHLDDARIKKGVRDKLVNGREQAFLSHTLAKILHNAPIETARGAYRRSTGNFAHAKALFSACEMFSTWSRFAHKQSSVDDLRENCPPAPWPGTLQGPVWLCFENDRWHLSQQGAVWIAEDEALLSLLEQEQLAKQCFDAKSLFRFALSRGAQVRNLCFDAKLAAYLLNPAAAEYSISRLCDEYGIQGSLRCDEAPGAAALPALCQALQAQCDAQALTPLLEKIELPLSEVLADMELRGVSVDKAGIEQFGTELQAALEQELSAIYKIVGYELNVNSPKQLGKALFEDLSLPTRKKNKSGFSTDAETLESLREYHPVIQHILDYRVYQKLRSTYVEGLLKEIADDGRIHSTFQQTETRTGRISSNEPNLQNIPVRTALGSRFRRYFRASTGCTLVDADYSQIELRILAHISQDKAMQEAFLSGEDIHRATAAKIYGTQPSDVTAPMRTAAKAVNFGIMYGKSAFSLGRDLSIPVKEAAAFIDAYLGTYPKVKQYMDDTIAQARKDGYVATLYGRRRSLPELSSRNFNLRAQGERMAMNTPIQGTAADIIKLAMVRVFHRLRTEQPAAHLILQVHDELIVECPLACADAVCHLVREEMERAAALDIPLTVDAHQGETWYDAKE